uniref:Uncharacterized protein n=1 Tax=Avena sativa TaxID=4498 RepID=A0ACD5U1U0_AVESA
MPPRELYHLAVPPVRSSSSLARSLSLALLSSARLPPLRRYHARRASISELTIELIAHRKSQPGGASMELRAGDGKCRLSTKRSGKLATARGGKSESGRSPSSFARRCARLVREQRARFYIARRCVTMLACWRERDSP